MPYVKRTTVAGRVTEVEFYYTSRYNRKGLKRSDKVHATKEAQQKVNKRQAERKLRQLVNANFEYSDYHVILDYVRDKERPDRTAEEMKTDIAKFLRVLRGEYRKEGRELKYIHVMEVGERGARHHHLIINQINTEAVQRAWYRAYEGHNRVKVFPLDDSGNYEQLTNYLLKYTSEHRKEDDGALMGKRYNCSKNLIRPQPVYEIVTHRAYYRISKEPKAPKGYYVLPGSVQVGVHSSEYYGYGYYRYTIVKFNKGAT